MQAKPTLRVFCNSHFLCKIGASPGWVCRLKTMSKRHCYGCLFGMNGAREQRAIQNLISCFPATRSIKTAGLMQKT